MAERHSYCDGAGERCRIDDAARRQGAQGGGAWPAAQTACGGAAARCPTLRAVSTCLSRHSIRGEPCPHSITLRGIRSRSVQTACLCGCICRLPAAAEHGSSGTARQLQQTAAKLQRRGLHMRLWEDPSSRAAPDQRNLGTRGCAISMRGAGGAELGRSGVKGWCGCVRPDECADADVHTNVHTDVHTNVQTDVQADVQTDVRTDVRADVRLWLDCPAAGAWYGRGLRLLRTSDGCADRWQLKGEGRVECL